MSTRGKKSKPRMGRPPLPASERKRAIEITLHPLDIERARKIGEGNVSRGIEIALRASANG